MHTTFAVPGNSRTILTHLFGRGLEDGRFDALADGEIRPRPAGAPAKKGRGKAKRTIASLRAMWRRRPARTEIIICTGLNIEGGVQIWGDVAKALDGLDYLGNNAGTPGTKLPIPAADFETQDEAFWNKLLNVNLIGPYRCTKAAAAQARSIRRGNAGSPECSTISGTSCRCSASACPTTTATPSCFCRPAPTT